MRKRMNFRKKRIMKAIAFVMVCGMTMGRVCLPIFAEEKGESLHNISDQGIESNQSNIEKNAGQRTDSVKGTEDESQKEKGGESTGKDTGNESGNDEDGTDTGKETGDKSGSNGDETGIGKETGDESGSHGNGTDAGKDTGNESGNDGDGIDTGKETGDESGSNGDRTDTGKDTGDGFRGDGDETDPGDDAGEEASKNTEKETVSGNDIEKEATEDKTGDEGRQEEAEIINVVVPGAYTLALNPYRLPVKTGEDEITTEQVISGMYGIVNKSSSDQIVTVSLNVEDGNAGELVFVDSAEEAEHAGKDVYAIYLTAVPANEGEILIDDRPVDQDVTGESLQNVRMTRAQEQAVALHEGANEISFKLFKAVYDVETEEENPENAHQENVVLKELAPDGMGVTAYTFSGVINPDASWEKLSGGIRLSVVYTYKTAEGEEEIVEGTGAMIRKE